MGAKRPRSAQRRPVNRVPEKRASGLKASSKWLGGVITALVIAVAAAIGTGAGQHVVALFSGSSAASQVQISASLTPGACQSRYLDETVAAAQSSGHYTGIPVGPGASIQITNQTDASEDIILTGIQVTILRQAAAPRSGIVVQPDPLECGGGGGGISPRPFNIDLSARPPTVVALPLTLGAGASKPPVSFPFSISRHDPEVFQLNLLKATGLCTLAVTVDWVVAGQRGHTTLDNGGRGFRVMAADPTLPRYQAGANPAVLSRVTPSPAG